MKCSQTSYVLTKLKTMNGEIETLRERMKAIADVEIEHLVDRLNLAPFKV